MKTNPKVMLVSFLLVTAILMLIVEAIWPRTGNSVNIGIGCTIWWGMAYLAEIVSELQELNRK